MRIPYAYFWPASESDTQGQAQRSTSCWPTPVRGDENSLELFWVQAEFLSLWIFYKSVYGGSNFTLYRYGEDISWSRC